MRQFDLCNATSRQRKSFNLLRKVTERVPHRGVFSTKTGFPYVLCDVKGQTISLTVRVPSRHDETRPDSYFKLFHNFATDLPQDPKVFRHSDQVVQYLETLYAE